MTPLQHALECAAQGMAVFPCGADKAPRTPNGFKAASTDPKRIRAMAAQFGFVAVGVATGETSGVSVLDIDRKNGGLDWWKVNRSRLPETRTHETKSGGLHLWFRHRPGLRCSASRIAPGVDVRADAGYCIWWPASGLRVLSDAPTANWPDWLTPKPKPAPTPHYEFFTPPSAARIEAQLAGLVRTIAAASEGQRNASLFWAACRTGELIARGELSKPHAEALLAEAARRAGLDHIEAERSVASAFNQGAHDE